MSQSRKKASFLYLMLAIGIIGIGFGLSLLIKFSQNDASAIFVQSKSKNEQVNLNVVKPPRQAPRASNSQITDKTLNSKPYTATAHHISKKFIQKNCALLSFESPLPVNGAAFISSKDKADWEFLALSHGKDGVSLYDTAGQRLWHMDQPADVVSAFGDTMLIYETIENSSRLERFKIGQDGTAKSIGIETPSEIAPTTLQRSSITASGPVSFKDNGLLLTTSFVKLSAKPVAVAAISAKFGSIFPKGAVAIGLENNQVEIWEFNAVTHGCN